MEEAFKVPDFVAKPLKPEEKPAEPEIPYKVPKFSGPLAANNYSFEILKNGVIVDKVNNLQEKPFWMIGRLPVGSGVDITAAHPTVSRFHAVLQYKLSGSSEIDENEVPSGFYIYDLDSTHGTFINKVRVKPRTYVRMKVGYQLKLGNSTRNYILQGPTEDEDDESEFTITELKEQKAQREFELREKELAEKLERERLEKEKENAGISWGMSEDAEEEPDLTENPFAQTNNEEDFDDPKKTLRGYFEREGIDLQYRCDELSPGVFICRVELPVDDEYGKNTICEVQHKGKKKDCVLQCALEACRTLDRHGVLRQARAEPRRAQKVGDDDDSDDDNFFDRTGDVEKKRLKKTQVGQSKVESYTYEQLLQQETEILDKIQTKEHKLELMIELEKRQKMQNDADLDTYMNNLSRIEQKVDKFAISCTKTEIIRLKIEHQKIKKLINIAKPSVTLSPITMKTNSKRPVLSRNFGVKRKETLPVEVDKTVKEFEVEIEDEEETEVLQQEPVPEKQPKLTNDETSVLIESSKLPSTSSAQSLKEPELKEPTVKKQKIEEEISKLREVDEQSNKNFDGSSKKRKPRFRTRNRLRENIDMNDDDEYVDEEKISTWVAPSNQSGDGTTHLNDKYGY